MRRLLSSVAKVSLSASLCLIVAIAVFDRTTVVPELVKAEAILIAADSAERDLPKTVKAALHRSLGPRLKYSVARTLLMTSPSQIVDMKTSSRQFTELSVGLLLPLHLSEEQMLSIQASQAFMGPGVQGFASAAKKHLGVPLAQVDPIQAAKLVVIARAPSLFLEDPERLERSARAMLVDQAE
jgi:hypothetical protein